MIMIVVKAEVLLKRPQFLQDWHESFGSLLVPV